jgi:hypothetical protein
MALGLPLVNYITFTLDLKRTLKNIQHGTDTLSEDTEELKHTWLFRKNLGRRERLSQISKPYFG